MSRFQRKLRRAQVRRAAQIDAVSRGCICRARPELVRRDGVWRAVLEHDADCPAGTGESVVLMLRRAQR